MNLLPVGNTSKSMKWVVCLFFMTFNTKVILCRCAERDQGGKEAEQKKKRLDLGKAIDSLGFLFETTSTPLAAKGQHLRLGLSRWR